MQGSKINHYTANQKEEGEKMIIEVLAVIMAFILGVLVGISSIVAIAFYVERRDNNGGKKES